MPSLNRIVVLKMGGISVSWFTVLVSSVPLLLILLIWRRITKMGASLPLPPGPPGLPIIGNLFQLGKKPHESLSALSQQYGPLMKLSLGMTTAVVVSSPEMAKEFLKTHDHIFAGRPLTQAAMTDSHHKSSLVLGEYGAHWQKLRRISSTQLITAKMLRSLQHLRRDQVFGMTRMIFEMKGKSVNIPHAVFFTGLNLIANMIFSRSILDPNNKDSMDFKEDFNRSVMLGGKPNLADFFPFLGFMDPQGVRRQLSKCYMRIDKFIDAFINNRLEGLDHEKDSEQKDFLDVLLELRGDDMSLIDIRILIFELLVAGSDTTSTTIEWVMAELIRNPYSLKRVQEELEDVVSCSKKVEESDIDKLPYLSAVIKEGFRLHPPLPFLIPHRAEKSCEIMGYMIPKHSQVMVNVWAMGRDPTNWKEPLKFFPERFLEGDNSNINYKGQDFEFIPFGSGRRICMGLPLAHRMVHLILASLVHSFEWTLPYGMNAKQLDMSDAFGINLKKDVELHAIPTPRLPHHLY